MAETTTISWADHTMNFWIGCAKVSPACDGCYAEALMDKRMGRVEWGGPGKGAGTRSLTSEANRKKPYAWDRKAKAEDRKAFVFCSSLADVFDNQVPEEWRAGLFKTIRETPNLVWLLLTKRPQLIVKLSAAAGGLPPNAAIGTTVEDQQRANKNVSELLMAQFQISPLFSFISAEPLLGQIDLTEIRFRHEDVDVLMNALTGETWIENSDSAAAYDADGPRLGWIITGGETDQGQHRARPTLPDNFRSLRDQCAEAGTPFHFKQWGNWASVSEIKGDPSFSSEHYTFEDGATVRRVRRDVPATLDGVMHRDMPRI